MMVRSTSPAPVRFRWRNLFLKKRSVLLRNNSCAYYREFQDKESYVNYCTTNTKTVFQIVKSQNNLHWKGRG